MSNAPIIVFAYKRPHALKRMIEGLLGNGPAADSPLIVFCDGPKADASAMDLRMIGQVEAMARTIQGFASVEVRVAGANKGLARSVIDGVTEVVDRYGRAIIVEDDAVLSPYFLRFMNDALDRYADNDAVFSVGSWNYFADPAELSGNFFLRYPDSLAWATWKRSWDLFEKDGGQLMARLKERKLLDRLDADGQVGYFSEMLEAQIKGKIDSWAIRWTANCILQGKVNYFPQVTMSINKGFGADATHENAPDHNTALRLATTPLAVRAMAPVETPEAIAAWTRYVKYHFEGGHDTSLKTRVWRALPSGLRQWYARRRSTPDAGPEALSFEPVSRVFGFDRGTPVDRYYIEKFLDAQRSVIHGHVMEIAETTYTERFGMNVTKSEALVHEGAVSSSTRTGDLTRPDTLPVGELDAFICTQTLNFIFDVAKAVRGLHAALKPGGHALVTVAGLVQISRFDADRWGDFWRFTPQGAQRLFEEVFGKGNVEVGILGNSYAAACLQKGFAVEECDKEILDRGDADYPVVITIKARKA